jgi:hypothetical protein
MVYASPIDEYELARASAPPIEKCLGSTPAFRATPGIVEDGATMSRVAVPTQSSDRRRTIGGSPKGHSRLSRGKVSVIDRRADDFRASC